MGYGQQRVIGRKTNLAFTGQVKQVVQQDSNITQLPDGQVQVSEKSGAHSMTQLSFKLQKETKAKTPQRNVQLALGQTRYFDRSFSNRNAQNVTLSFQEPFQSSKASKWMSWSAKLSQRVDFLYAFGPKKLAFSTTTMGAMGIIKPKNIKKKHVDTLVPVLGLDLEFRDFKGAFEKDATAMKKDSLTPSFTGILMGLKSYKSFKSRSMILTNLRRGFADSKGEEYLNLRFGLSWTAEVKAWTLTPDLTCVLRRQSDYNGSKRNDDRYEGGFSVGYDLKKWKTQFQGSLKYSEQSSNLSTFEYNNTQVGLSGTHRF